MNTTALLGIALVGAAAFFGWQMYSQQTPATSGGSGGGSTSGGSGGGGSTSGNGSGNGSGSGNGAGSGNGGGGGAADPIAALHTQLWNAAKNDANRRGGKMHWWEWLYFMPAGVPHPAWEQTTDANWAQTSLGHKPANTDEVVNTPVTFEQFWAMALPQLRASQGLSGLGATDSPVLYEVMRRAGYGARTPLEWNFFFERLTGRPGFDPFALGLQAVRMSPEEWWDLMKLSGLSGLGSLRGCGCSHPLIGGSFRGYYVRGAYNS